jgi:hypothetical protein
MKKPQPPAWLSMLPGGLASSTFSLEELRATKLAHSFLTEQIPGPEGLAYYVRGFRCLLFFAVACISENKHPPLTRCWKHLGALFLKDPAFDDDVFIQSWILMDFPFGPEGQTALDYFQEFLTGTGVGPDLQPFIEEARRSRLGLYQDVLRTKRLAKFRELFTGRVIAAFPSIEAYGNGEILLTRTMTYKDQVFLWGSPKGFPKEVKGRIEEMVRDKLFYFFEEGKSASEVAQYETFMKLAGPYWMSCVTKNDDIPILEPDQYLSYLREDE